MIKVGFLVSYDWYLLEYSLPAIYEAADVIWLALDRSRKTWSGNKFEFDKIKFEALIQSIDKQRKVSIYEEDFYVPTLSAMQCEVRERNLLARQMGPGGWHVQLDVDEYFLGFADFVSYINKINPDPSPSGKPLNICASWLSLVKKTGNGYLYVDNQGKNLENVPVATNVPVYEYGRKNGHFNHVSPFFLIHETWARDEKSFQNKLQSWGHADDFNRESYLRLWQALDENNYKYVSNFHPIEPGIWERLSFGAGDSVAEFLQNLSQLKYPLPGWKLRVKNSRNLARLKHQYERLLNRFKVSSTF